MHPEIAGRDVEFRRQSEAARASLLSDVAVLEKLQAKFIKRCGGKEPGRNGDNQAMGASNNGGANRGAAGQRSVKAFSVDTVRTQYPNAYRPWTAEEDADITRRFKVGEKTQATAQALGRQPSAIRSRLAKLGLLHSDARQS